MANYELIALNEATPQLRAPGAADTGVVSNLSVTANADVGGTLGVTGAITNTAGTANGVVYMNGSKVQTSTTALQFNGTNLVIGATTSRASSILDARGSVTIGANATYYGTLSYNAGTGAFDCRGEDSLFTWTSSIGPTILQTLSTTGLAVTGAVSATTTIRSGGYTVATLPAGASGDRAYVTDATTPAYNTALTGGGAVVVPVFKNATVWVSC